MKLIIAFIFAFMVGLPGINAQNKLEISGIMPDSAAKTGSWSEWQSVKKSDGVELAQYRVRMASAGKFTSSSVECKYEVEVKSLYDDVLYVDLTYSYYQTLGGSSEWKDGERRGIITKKNKSWTFEMLAFNDKEEKQERADACKDCDLSYKLIFSWK